MRSFVRLLALMSAIVFLGSITHGATISGTVKGADGAPYEGAFIQAQNQQSKISTIVLSNGQGKFRVPDLAAGTYKVSIKAMGFSAPVQDNVTLTADQNASSDFSLAKAGVRYSELSFYQGMHLFPPDKGKDLIVEKCSICHMWQTKMAGVSRDQDGYLDRVNYMRSQLNVGIKPEDADTIAAYLAKLFGPDSVLPKSAADLPGYQDVVRKFSDDAMNIVYVEYEMPGPGRMPFSAAPDKDGYLWIPNFGSANRISRLDSKTGKMDDYTVPNVGAARVHSAQMAPDGSVWLTEQQPDKLGRWDPVTKQITEWQDLGPDGTVTKGGQKHTLRVAPDGRVWSSGQPFTMFDYETKKFTRYDKDLPSTYDVKVDVHTGEVWMTAPGANKIGRIDPKTLQATTWVSPTPKGAPRRIVIAPDGMIWYDEFNAGKVTRFDPKTQTFNEYQLPGPDPTPYPMGVSAKGDIWYASHHQDTVGHVDPKTGQVTEYPFPHSENDVKELMEDSQGRMWYGSAPNNRVGYFYIAGKNGMKSSGN
jgi:virginiamycin B lyase